MAIIYEPYPRFNPNMTTSPPWPGCHDLYPASAYMPYDPRIMQLIGYTMEGLELVDTEWL